MGGVAQEVEDTGVRNIAMIDRIVLEFFENADNTINPSEQTDSPKCHKFYIKDRVISEFLKLMSTKGATMVGSILQTVQWFAKTLN